MNADVSVVVPNWNGLRWLPRCLDSLQDQTGVSVEVIVVDNGSGDFSPDYLRTNGIPFVAFDRNRGFAAAVNTGIARTSAPFVFVVNVDTTTGRDCLVRLADALTADASLGGVQPTIFQSGTSPRRIYSAGQVLVADGRAYERGAGMPARTANASPEEIFGVCGAACMLRRDMLDRIGAYDERYFAFYEDVELNIRARANGWRFALVGTASVEHVGNATWQQQPRANAFNVRLVARNRLATALRSLPASRLPQLFVVECGSLARSARRGLLGAALRGRAEALAQAPRLLRERRVTRRGARRWNLDRWLCARPPQ